MSRIKFILKQWQEHHFVNSLIQHCFPVYSHRLILLTIYRCLLALNIGTFNYAVFVLDCVFFIAYIEQGSTSPILAWQKKDLSPIVGRFSSRKTIVCSIA